MPNGPTWLVQLFVDGPVAVQDVIRFQHPKGFGRSRQFYSDVRVQGTASGLRIFVTAYARDSDLARKAALVFVGEMLNVLTADLKLSLKLSLYDARTADRDAHSVKRILRESEIQKAFSRARWLSENEPTFMRALSWYRKGLVTEDPLDKFLALWISIEIAAAKYHPPVDVVARGIKSQIWESFKMVWGPIEHWPIITGQQHWIDENHALRVQIAHGTTPVDVDEVERAVAKSDVIRDVAHLFLKNMAAKHFSNAYDNVGAV
jgi:hypothetical protein